MRLTHSLLIVLTLLLASGCSTNKARPYDGGDQGLVVFAMDVSAQPGNQIRYDYLFTIRNLDTDETHQMRVTPWVGDEYEYLGSVPAGRYGITKRVTVRKGGAYFNPQTMYGMFEVHAGKISIPVKLVISARNNTQYVDAVHLVGDERKTLFETHLAPRPDMAGWELK